MISPPFLILLFLFNRFCFYCLLIKPRIKKIYAILREKNGVSAFERLKATMEKYQIRIPSYEKLHSINSEYTRDRFGLSDDEYKKLSLEIDTVFHCGGSTNRTYTYRYYRKEGNFTILKLLEFCTTGRLKALHYIGTLGTNILKEKKDFKRKNIFYCGYIKMKWINRITMEYAYSRGIPAYTYLTPYVIGSELTSFKEPGEYYALWILTMISVNLGKIREVGSDEGLPVIPADHLADITVTSTLSKKHKIFSSRFTTSNAMIWQALDCTPKTGVTKKPELG